MSSTNVVLAGRYRLDSRIAAGGAGEVWRAVDVVLDRPVAVKLLREEYAQHAETLARFRAEARHAGSLSHPGIAQVYDYGEAEPGQAPYLVMELVDGPSLAGVLAGGPLDAARAMDVAAQTAAGLAAAHTAGLVHRDIKPANLLLGPDGQVKITDFGIAYAAGSAPITRVGTVMGTAAYLAPERAAGAAASPASDLYSLGVVAYECLAGVPPFRGDPAEVAAAHRRDALPPLPPATPPPVAALVAALTAKDPAVRLGGAAQVAERAGQLRDALAAGGTATVQLPPCQHMGPPAPAATPTLTLSGLPAQDTTPARPWLQRAMQRPRWSRVLALAAAVVTAGLAGWLLAGTFGATPPQPSGAPPAPTASAARTVLVNGGLLAGQPVSVVRQQLRQLGLQPRVVWVRSAQQAPGTVVSVQPSGHIPVGSIVTVIAALQTHGHGHGNGKGNGGD
ncbi:MAG TPA: serine/threonine protein kinase [Streptosporangiaceae bacterium]